VYFCSNIAGVQLRPRTLPMYSYLTPPVGPDGVEINSRREPWCICDRLLRGDEFTHTAT
jgi:hypothetical protein